MKRLALLATALVVLAAAPSAKADDYPAPDGYVVDTAGVLPAGAEAALERELSGYDRRTTNQVAVLVIRSLDGQEIEGYATSLFNQWGIGQRGKDNGVLLLLALDDRQDRIEVGLGLEKTVTHRRAQLILDNVMRPALRRADYVAAVTNGERAVRALLGDRSVAAAAPQTGDVFQGGTDAPAEDLLSGPAPTDAASPDSGGASSVGWIFVPIGLLGLVALGALFGGGGGPHGPGPRRGGFWGGYGGWGGMGGGTGGGMGGGGGGSFGGGSSGGGGASGSW